MRRRRWVLGWTLLALAGGGAAAGAAPADVEPLRGEVRRGVAGAFNARRNARFQHRLAACLAARGIHYAPQPDDGDAPVLDPSVGDGPALRDCLADASAKRAAETLALLAGIETRLAALDRNPKHVAALRRWTRCMRQATGRRFRRPEDARGAAEAALQQAQEALEPVPPPLPPDPPPTPAELQEHQEATQRVRERNRMRLDEARAAADTLAAANADCQRSTDLAAVRATLIGEVVQEAESRQPALMDSAGGMP